MRVQYVPTELTAQSWPQVEKYIESALPYGNDDYTLEQIKLLVLMGQWLLTVAIDEDNKVHGAATISFINYPNDRVGFITACGGKFIANKEKNYESDYNRVITSGDIKVVYRFMERCSKDGMHSFLRLVQEEILKQGREFKDRINQSLDEENVKVALEQAKKLFEYKEVFGKNILEIENSYTDILE